VSSNDPRPVDCRERTKEEGGAYPRSCRHCSVLRCRAGQADFEPQPDGKQYYIPQKDADPKIEPPEPVTPYSFNHGMDDDAVTRRLTALHDYLIDLDRPQLMWMHLGKAR
jgi:hypothetical protein